MARFKVKAGIHVVGGIAFRAGDVFETTNEKFCEDPDRSRLFERTADAPTKVAGAPAGAPETETGKKGNKKGGKKGAEDSPSVPPSVPPSADPASTQGASGDVGGDVGEA